MILIIDNYDSFTYNLYQFVGQINPEVKVVRNNEITTAEITQLQPGKIIISPGPCYPKDAGISRETIQRFGQEIPILGVCLGHQCIGDVFGGRVVQAQNLYHGKTSPIIHNGQGIFAGLPNPFRGARYHSLIVDQQSLPEVLEITAQTQQGEIMGLKHKKLPIYGVQFHPESIMTEEGIMIIKNFLEIKGDEN